MHEDSDGRSNSSVSTPAVKHAEQMIHRCVQDLPCTSAQEVRSSMHYVRHILSKQMDCGQPANVNWTVLVSSGEENGKSISNATIALLLTGQLPSIEPHNIQSHYDRHARLVNVNSSSVDVFLHVGERPKCPFGFEKGPSCSNDREMPPGSWRALIDALRPVTWRIEDWELSFPRLPGQCEAAGDAHRNLNSCIAFDKMPPKGRPLTPPSWGCYKVGQCDRCDLRKRAPQFLRKLLAWRLAHEHESRRGGLAYDLVVAARIDFLGRMPLPIAA